MPYSLRMAVNPDRIDGESYALMKTKVGFTPITSCVGVIVQTEGFISAFHLVARGRDDTSFDASAAADMLRIINHLPVPRISKIHAIGHWSSWQRESLAYRQMIDTFTAKGIDVVNDFDNDGDGTYEVTLAAGEIVVRSK